MRRSVYNECVARPALAVATRTNGAVNGLTVDKHYQNNAFRSVMFIVHSGTMTDGSVAVTMQDSPDNSTWTAVDASYVQGSLPTIASTDDDKTFEIGYTGPQRYVRIVATTSGATTGGTFGATAVMWGARRRPAVH
ncbi:hypothetical protein N5079_19760 [Planotetraspora sp. A-T 1434]|uniref:hypothetical protein n=1 Tax=Planotetraspora sp. A-T 1434 TaxID=2979219 RepID=UPI0021C03843|nr:hypothetical protein [Planotetraspora sp. A-T 1434]MCT9932441.1 hypothetical protein [Planotetraspora sp. A-T 1434]